MARAIVTPELADTLRNIRIQNKIQAKTLAAHINKSPAYVSKLEKCGIQTIDTSELYEIISFIIGDLDDPAATAEMIYASLKFKYSKKEIEEQLWFTNFDTVERQIPVPESLIDELNRLIEEQNISYAYLLERINSNEALTDEEKNDNSIVYNQWFCPESQTGIKSCIKIKMDEEQLRAILSKKRDTSSYIYLLCIALCVYKIRRFGDRTEISIDDYQELMTEATNLLNSHKFLSIAQKDKLLSEKQSQDDFREILSTFEKDNIDIVTDIFSGFQFASERDIKTTNRQLQQFRDNMHWDLGFMLRIISLDYCCLEKTSVSNRRNLIKAIEKLLEDYAQLPEEQNKIEIY